MNLKQKEKTGIFILASALILALIAMFLIDPIAQDKSYHNFVDSRKICSVLNFWNVASNLLFLYVGLTGLYKVSITKVLKINEDLKFSYILLFAGITLVAFGSAYYHLWPDNQTLVWDRLPMTIAFMALLSIMVSEFISIDTGKKLLIPLILIGMVTVIYWYITELRGTGDLRFYVIIQFYTVLAIPVILLCFKSQYNKITAYGLLLATYVLAKLLELFDTEVYVILGESISGHSLKHIIAAIGLYILLTSYQQRTKIIT